MLKKTSLIPVADDKTVLKNPHKGWYWHYFDNGMIRPWYRDKTEKGETYEKFPGLNHLYLRIDWSDVQPAPDKFDWSEVDRTMDEWGKYGYTFSFRVCCHESWPEQCFATPKWLYDMGCTGNFYKRGPQASGGILTDENGGGTWEPNYSDPMFLEYLEKFIIEFAGRYDGDPRIEYIDIGSYGIWGEGHTYQGSKKCFGVETLTKHLIIHAKYFKKTPLIVNDDFIMQLYGCPDSEKEQLRDLCITLGFGIRDDSVLVGSWDYKRYHNVEFPKLFCEFSKGGPSNIELAHLWHYTKEQSKDGLRAIEASRACRATYMGFHSYPDEWLNEYYYVTEYLANRLGYWYFINYIEHNDTAYTNSKTMIELEWENRGDAPSYNKYELQIKFSKDGHDFIYDIPEFDNTTFMEGEKYIERYFPRLSEDMPEGQYDISIRLYDSFTNSLVKLGIKNELCDNDGFYKVSEINIKEGFDLCE